MSESVGDSRNAIEGALEEYLRDGELDAREIEALATQLSESDSPEQKELIGQVLLRVHQQVTTMSGPLPPPEILAQYEQVYGGAADRIISMAEEQSAHRRTMESELVRASVNREKQGMWIGGALAVVFAVLGVLLSLNDKDLQGFTILIAELVGLVGLFTYSRHASDKESRTGEEND